MPTPNLSRVSVKFPVNLFKSKKSSEADENDLIFEAINVGDWGTLRDHNQDNQTTVADPKTGEMISKLLLACQKGKPSIIRYLLGRAAYRKKNQDMHDWDKNNQNPFIEVIKQGNMESIEEFVRHEDFFKKSFKDKDGKTPFHFISELKDEKVRKEIAKLLILHGMDIHLTNNKNEKPANIKELEELQKSVANHYPDSYAEFWYFKPKGNEIKDNLLSIASRIVGIVFLTMTAGVFVSLALEISALFMIPVLLNLGLLGCCFDAIVSSFAYAESFQAKQDSIKKQQAESELIHAIENDRLTQEQLDKAKKDGLNIKNDALQFCNTSSLFGLAAEKGKLSTMQLLMKNDAHESELVKYSGFMDAVYYSQYETVKYLLQHKEFKWLNQFHSLFLDVAVGNRDTNMVKLLVDNGAYTGPTTDLNAIYKIYERINEPRLRTVSMLKICENQLEKASKENPNSNETQKLTEIVSLLRKHDNPPIPSVIPSVPSPSGNNIISPQFNNVKEGEKPVPETGNPEVRRNARRKRAG